MATFVLIDINSDLDPIAYEIDTDEQVHEARKALRDAGLAYEDVWTGDPNPGEASNDNIKTGAKLFAYKPGTEEV